MARLFKLLPQFRLTEPSVAAVYGPPSLAAVYGPPSVASVYGPPSLRLAAVYGPPSVTVRAAVSGRFKLAVLAAVSRGPPSVTVVYGPPSVADSSWWYGLLLVAAGRCQSRYGPPSVACGTGRGRRQSDTAVYWPPSVTVRAAVSGRFKLAVRATVSRWPPSVTVRATVSHGDRRFKVGGTVSHSTARAAVSRGPPSVTVRPTVSGRFKLAVRAAVSRGPLSVTARYGPPSVVRLSLFLRT
jgi:hypothetical protein